MSLLETAERHGLNTQKYIPFLLEHLTNEETLAKKEILEVYLLCAETIQKILDRKTSRVNKDFGSFQYNLLLNGYVVSDYS